jgi:hypothetical protein
MLRIRFILNRHSYPLGDISRGVDANELPKALQRVGLFLEPKCTSRVNPAHLASVFPCSLNAQAVLFLIEQELHLAKSKRHFSLFLLTCLRVYFRLASTHPAYL